MSTTSEPPVVLLTPQRAAVALGMGRWKLSDLLGRADCARPRIGSCGRISTAALLEFVTELVRTRVYRELDRDRRAGHAHPTARSWSRRVVAARRNPGDYAKPPIERPAHLASPGSPS
jgi:hypothetical protein